MPRTLVEVGPIREAVEEYRQRNHLTWSGLARELGWMTHHKDYRSPVPDVSRLKRRLGLTHQTSGKGNHYRIVTQRVNSETATLLICHVGKDPVDFGF